MSDTIMDAHVINLVKTIQTERIFRKIAERKLAAERDRCAKVLEDEMRAMAKIPWEYSKSVSQRLGDLAAKIRSGE